MENKGKLQVEYYTTDNGRGDGGSDSQAIAVEELNGETDGGDIKATLPRATTPFVLGGRPDIPVLFTL